MPSLRSTFSLLPHFRKWEADLLFGYEWDRQDASVANEPSSHFERMTYTEELRLGSKGYFYDPRLLSIGLSGTFGLFQEQASVSGEPSNSNGTLLGYDASAVLFPEKPYSLTAFGNRTEDIVTREFAGTTKVLLENYDSSLLLRDMPLDSVFGLRHERVRENLDSGPNSARREEVRDVASYHGTRVGEVSDLDLNYEFDDVADKVLPTLDFQTHDGGVTYHYFFGPYLEKNFYLRARIFDREGRFSTLVGQTSESLRIDHTETFSSNYDYSLLYSSVSGAGKSLTHAGSAGIQHQLFGSLRTDLQALGNYSDFENGQAFGYGGTLGVTYTKRLPFEGRFTAGGRGAYRIDDQTLPSGTLPVFQERHAVQDFQPIFLTNPRVQLDTIVVTDEAGKEVFKEGFDYTVTLVGDLAELLIQPGGDLHTRGVTGILIDYRFATARKLEFATSSRGFNLGIDYDSFSVYFQRQQTDESLLSGDNINAQFLDDITDQTAGAQVRWSGPQIQASGLGEYRTYDSRRVAFTTPHALQSLSWLSSRTLTCNVTMSESFFHFSRPQSRDTQTLLARLTTTWRPARRLFIDAFASYLRQDDTVAPDERLYDTGLRAQFEYGRLRLIPTIAFARREVGTAKTDEVRATLTLIRKLF
ncbi:MAG: hypothetical protein ACHQ9S_10495 [Candidatus Binatia bacterium]